MRNEKVLILSSILTQRIFWLKAEWGLNRHYGLAKQKVVVHQIIMLDALIQSKTRLKLLLRFFLNPDSEAYLRGLAQEFGESTNAVRVELNRFEEAGLIVPHKEGNKKVFQVNAAHPMYSDLQRIAFKHFGLDQIVEKVIKKLGNVQAVYLTGDLARGLDAKIIDISLIGEVDTAYLAQLVEKSEALIKRKIRTLVYGPDETVELKSPKLLIFGEEAQSYDT